MRPVTALASASQRIWTVYSAPIIDKRFTAILHATITRLPDDVKERHNGNVKLSASKIPTSASSGIFNWDASALTPDPLADYNFDVTIKAYNDSDLLTNWTNATVKLGPNATVVSANVQVVPQILRLTPSESTTDSIQISYRKMGDTSAIFTALI